VRRAFPSSAIEDKSRFDVVGLQSPKLLGAEGRLDPGVDGPPGVVHGVHLLRFGGRFGFEGVEPPVEKRTEAFTSFPGHLSSKIRKGKRHIPHVSSDAKLCQESCGLSITYCTFLVCASAHFSTTNSLMALTGIRRLPPIRMLRICPRRISS
jgi:hypothetical protein